MNIFQALILSVIEGITEFLPISSTGHLILASRIMDIKQTEFTKSFEIIIQLGAILAVVVLYGKKFFSDRKMWPTIIATFIPTAAVGFLLYGPIKSYLLGNGHIVVASLILGGMALIFLDRLKKPIQIGVHDLTVRDGTLIGLFQSVSVIPGVSRSAATIVGGMFRGLSRQDAVYLSFLSAVPVMAAATGYDLLKSYRLFTPRDFTLILVGFMGSFVTAMAAVRWLLSYVKNRSFTVFGIYRIIAGILFYLMFYR